MSSLREKFPKVETSGGLKMPPLTDSSLSSWTLAQELFHSMPTLEKDPKKQTPVWITQCSRDGRFVATGGHDGLVKSTF